VNNETKLDRLKSTITQTEARRRLTPEYQRGCLRHVWVLLDDKKPERHTEREGTDVTLHIHLYLPNKVAIFFIMNRYTNKKEVHARKKQ